MHNEIFWNALTLSHFDPRTNQCEKEVQRIIHLQNVANQLPDVFTDTNKIIKSHVPAANVPAKINVPVGQSINVTANASKIHLKRGRLVGAKDVLRKKKTQRKLVFKTDEMISLNEAKTVNDDNVALDKAYALNEAMVPENDEISLNYEIRYSRNEIVIDNIFSYSVTLDIENEDPEP
ncbi:uncharacterized protein LOC132304835 [Cornus florida]|uniref:uncharacterized protein LOC132304835 n=1 Tax=Cornus florida TaxID=4283 RepID=UPI00289B251E|nr:uncharacterized protein LOC132304835 [Cornus florida]